MAATLEATEEEDETEAVAAGPAADGCDSLTVQLRLFFITFITFCFFFTGKEKRKKKK